MHSYYLKVVLWPSLVRTFGILGGWRTFVLPVVVFIAGYAAHKIGIWHWPRLENLAGSPKAELAIFIMYGLAAVLIVGMIVWVGSLVYAPYAAYKEQESKIAEEKKRNEKFKEEHPQLGARLVLHEHEEGGPIEIDFRLEVYSDAKSHTVEGIRLYLDELQDLGTGETILTNHNLDTPGRFLHPGDKYEFSFARQLPNDIIVIARHSLNVGLFEDNAYVGTIWITGLNARPVSLEFKAVISNSKLGVELLAPGTLDSHK